MDHRYKKFIALVETGSYSAAAKKLRISQPAMTISIATLEKSLRKKLIARKKPHIELTKDGMIVFATAKKIVSEIDAMSLLLNDEVGNSATNVGFIDSIAHLVYNSSQDNILLNDIEVMVDNSKRIIGDIVTNQIDYGFITGQPTRLSKDIVVHELHNEPFVFVKKASMVSDKKVDVIGDWLAFNRASTSYYHFTKLFKRQGLNVTPVFYSTSMELLKDMALAGNGTALLPSHFVGEYVRSGALKIVNTKPLFRPIWIVAKKEHSMVGGELLINHVNGLLAKANYAN